MIRAGYCYHDGHLRIVLNDPDLDDYVLVVGVTSVYPNAKRQDKTCVLDKDRDPEKSHPFIEHQSIIDYGRASKLKSEIIQDNVNNKYAKAREKISEKLLRRIIEGLSRTDALEREVENYAKLLFPDLNW